ncbi:MAG: phytoene synthase, partial [Rhodobacteraceae bacterium]|nr:phytoene synthase [Paracoccaceae bacterium]
VPELEARGRVPLVDGRAAAVAALARQGLGWLDEARAAGLPRAAAPALRAAWQAGPILRLAARNPDRVGQGALARSEAARRAGLLWRALLGTW